MKLHLKKWSAGCVLALAAIMLLTQPLSVLAEAGTAEDILTQDAVEYDKDEIADADTENEESAKEGSSTSKETASASDASADVSETKDLVSETAASDSVELINDLSPQAEEEVDYELASDSDAILINDLTVLTQTAALTALEEVERPDPPVISSIINTTSGLKITWEEAEDAERYYVYRKSADEGSYTRIKATTHTYYTDTDVTDGITYSYRIRTRSESATSDDSDTMSYKRLEPTTITKLTNTATALELTWDETDSARKYYIYRKASGESGYTQIRATAKNTYADTDVTNGVTYSYRVVVNNGGSYVSAYSATKSCKRLKKTTISGVTNTSSGLKITWNSVSNAKKYYVYRKADGESSYTRIRATTHTYYTDTDVESGVIYTYRIKVNNGSYTSAYSDAKKYKRLSPATITKISNTSTALKLTWDAVDGASRYHIYRKATGESSYTKVRVTAKTSWPDTNVTNGTTYSYRVYTISGSYSGAASATKSYKRLTRPDISGLANSASQEITVSWGKNARATGYQIQYSLEDSTFTACGSVKASVAKVSKAISGLEKTGLYYFRIRSYYKTDSANYYSAWSTVQSQLVRTYVQDHAAAEIRAYYNANPFSISKADTWSVTPSISTETPGTLTEATRTNALNTLNFIRYIAGLDEVGYNVDQEPYIQAGTTLLTKIGYLTHVPSQPSGVSDDFYQMAYTGTSESNLAWGYNALETLSEAIIEGWMDDGDSSNIENVGHRRWCLDPNMQETAFGHSGAYTAMYTFDSYNRYWTLSHEWDYIAWPAQTMPVNYFYGPWSVSLSKDNYSTSQSDYENVVVTLTNRSSGKTYTLDSSNTDVSGKYFNISFGGSGNYAPAIIFEPNVTFSSGDQIDVSITGLIDSYGNDASISYTVDFFRL